MSAASEAVSAAPRPLVDSKPAGTSGVHSMPPKLTPWQRWKALLATRFKHKGPKVPFPPPSWFEDGHVVNPGASEDAAVPLPHHPEAGDDKQDGDGPGGGGGGDEAPPPPATWIAHKVSELLNAYQPTPASGTDSSASAPAAADPPPDSNPSPPPPRPPVDSKLAKLLSTAYIMNGSISKGRRSVWTALEKLGAPSIPPAGDNSGAKQGDYTLMLYSPIMPTSKDLVEVASSHTETIFVEATDEDAEGDEVSATKWRWPFPGWGGKPTPTTPPAKDPSPPKQPKEVIVWEPSLTKLSVQVMWWGYRLWLPPPILAILGDKTLEASKRAVIITTALKWLVDNIPVKLLPPPLQPAVLILQKIVPFVGYIGAFIAWSWSALQQFDKGNGITLTATWLLPVALIPGTWSNEDLPPKAPTKAPVPGSSGPPKSAPLPEPAHPPVLTPLPEPAPSPDPIVISSDARKGKGVAR